MAFQSTKYYDYSEKAKDGIYFIKKKFLGYDVVILNIMNVLLVDVIHPDLQKEFSPLKKCNYTPSPLRKR